MLAVCNCNIIRELQHTLIENIVSWEMQCSTVIKIHEPLEKVLDEIPLQLWWGYIMNSMKDESMLHGDSNNEFSLV